ncbi:transketolase [Nematocida homosporus]|uniref:transketolase n=1 Tax=Nematocida homosporus TaxID=1912981 RepID=UPI00221E51E8|nr:transketolase [Nematocida homosporus]KAI5187739.1 transketolase [Nematocida homosporus]
MAMFTSEIRAICAEMVDLAQSGHPGSAMSLVPIMNVLFRKMLRISKVYPNWENRDILILSNGHACPVVYAYMYLLGYLEHQDLREFRRLGSKTPGHPEVGPGVEAATGPLGQGIGQSVGYALALRSLQRYNREDLELFTGRVFCIAGDGCMQEGVAFEALSLAGHLGLSNLVVVYDCNRITIDGSLDLSSSEDVCARMSALGFVVRKVADGENEEEIEKALQPGGDKPVFVLLHTVIAQGSLQAGSKQTHGAPLAKEDLKQLKAAAQVPAGETLWFPAALKAEMAEVATNRVELVREWQKKLVVYEEKYPELYRELMTVTIPELPDLETTEWQAVAKEQQSWWAAQATRVHLKQAMELLGGHPRILGGSADLASSTLCRRDKAITFTAQDKTGQFVNFGVREHGMCAILSGVAGFGWHFGFGSTFLNFISYGFPALRIAAMSGHSFALFGTHDSVGLGEDGPSHQPVEILPLLRATPGLITFRPCNGVETLFAVHFALFQRAAPCVLALTRQKIASVPNTSLSGAARGGYIIKDYEPSKSGQRILLLATGSEVPLVLAAQDLLPEYNIRVVSLLSFELFGQQTAEYIQATLVGDVSISVEASSTFGWSKYAQYQIGIDTFGYSAPGADIMAHFGFTPRQIADQIVQYANKQAST